MHFFNPVRYMKLLELVAGPDTSPETLERVRRFGEDALGKGIVLGKDTPNFVGNRIGAHAMMTAIHVMLAEGLAPEDIDALTGEPMAHPKSACFRTADLVGIDTFVHVADNCFATLTSDEDRKVFEMPAYMRGMIEKKLLGDKTKGGFYKRGKQGEIETSTRSSARTARAAETRKSGPLARKSPSSRIRASASASSWPHLARPAKSHGSSSREAWRTRPGAWARRLRRELPKTTSRTTSSRSMTR